MIPEIQSGIICSIISGTVIYSIYWNSRQKNCFDCPWWIEKTLNGINFDMILI
jgi:hypothetical protein